MDAQNAIIATIAALIGAAIPTVLGYIYTRKQSIKEKQKDVYNHFLQELQSFANSNAANDKFPSFQSAVNQICLYGDNETSKAVNNYYREMISQAMGTRKLIEEIEHHTFQKKIMNAMRENLGLKPLDKFNIDIFIGANKKN